MAPLDVALALPDLAADLAARGYATLRLRPEAADREVSWLVRALATPSGQSVGGDAVSYEEVITTQPSSRASVAQPFNRPEAIGWHNDFSTRGTRPDLTLAYIDRPDPRGPAYGAWRVASCDGVLDRLRGSSDGQRALQFLLETPIPFLVSEGDEPVVFRALETRGAGPGRLGLRFYPRAMRAGAVAKYGQISDGLEHAIYAVEDAADAKEVTLRAFHGALLIVDNWHCLHDRLPQSVDLDLPLRRAFLRFVARWGDRPQT